MSGNDIHQKHFKFIGAAGVRGQESYDEIWGGGVKVNLMKSNKLVRVKITRRG